MDSKDLKNQEKEKELEKIQEQIKKIYEVSEQKYQSEIVKGFDFNKGIDFEQILECFGTTGFQCTQFHLASKQIMSMINDQSTIFFGYTSNMVSSGTREIIRYLVQHKMVDVLVTSAGGIEEDFIKCILPFYVGSWNVNDQELRRNAINRIGNIFVPSLNYCKLEEWLLPIFNEMLEEQIKNKKIWSPSSMIKLLGEKINNPESIYYWAAKNDIPVFCPAITDGAVGDMLFYNSYKNDEQLIIDVVQDVVKLNKIALKAKTSGVITLGAGLIKHHILNANIWRNGADYGVFINTAVDFDGSDSGAKPTEAVTWGKVKIDSQTVKIFGEASFVFPFLVANTFAKNFEKASKVNKVKEEEKFVL